MQSLSPGLVAQQERLQRIVGVTDGNQFFLVQATDDEAALRQEETLAGRLQLLVSQNILTGFLAPAAFVPSASRQYDNRRLVVERLDPLLAKQMRELGLIESPPPDDANAPVLTIDEAVRNNGALTAVAMLVPEAGTHVVTLVGVADANKVAQAAIGLDGVHFVDSASQFSDLLGKYRWRALALLALSAGLMGLLLAYRYGRRGAAWIMLPPIMAVVLVPALRALAGGAFTFFDAMGLVLVLSIGVDYAIFCAETAGPRQPVTMLAVALAACTAQMSFGLLALSRVVAVHAFGTTMLVGILLAFLFSPIARRGAMRRSKPLAVYPQENLEQARTAWTSAKPFVRQATKVCLVVATALGGTLLAGCAKTAADPPPGSVRLAPGVVLALAGASELGQNLQAAQLVTATYGEQTVMFGVHISATPERFLLVISLDPVGQTLLTMTWNSQGLTAKPEPWLPRQVRPENMLADIMLIYWPEAALRHALSVPDGAFVVGTRSRTVSVAGKEVIRIAYGGDNPWDGSLTYRNLARGYQLAVDSVSAATAP
jgi:hypothetical protein